MRVKIKTLRTTTIHLSELLNKIIQKMVNIKWCWRYKTTGTFNTLPVGRQNVTLVKKEFKVSDKFVHTATILPRNPSSRHLFSQEKWGPMFAWKPVCNYFHNHQHMEVTQMSFTQEMNKQMVVHVFNGM